MDCQKIITSVTEPQGQLGELAQVFDLTQNQPIIATLQQYRWTGHQGYSLSALWRSYIASFVMDLPHTNALIRILEDNPSLRNLCGFHDQLPHRTTTFQEEKERFQESLPIGVSCTSLVPIFMPVWAFYELWPAINCRLTAKDSRHKLHRPPRCYTSLD